MPRVDANAWREAGGFFDWRGLRIYHRSEGAGDALLLVATDRISAFDYVLGSGIPDKGKVLTQLSAFWFEQTADLVPNHLLTMEVSAYPADLRRHADVLAGRSMLGHVLAVAQQIGAMPAAGSPGERLAVAAQRIAAGIARRRGNA